MKNTTQDIRKLAGLYERQPQPTNAATELVNWTVDKYTGGWDSRIGYERYNVVATSTFTPFAALPRIDSLCVFNKHQGAQQNILFTSYGSLYHLYEAGATMALKVIDAQRNIPTKNELPTTYAPYGQWVIITNGYDKPIKYMGWPVHKSAVTFRPPKFELGWHTVPSPPEPWGVETDPTATTSNTQAVCIFFPSNITYPVGLGSRVNTEVNEYKWRVSFINNTGSESPLSDASATIDWVTANTNTHAAYIEIPRGPDGTVARRLYRTKNFSTDGGAVPSLFYFVKDINNNFETSVYDSVPDASLGSEAPGITESITFPATRTRFSAVYKDCLFIEGGADNDTMVFYSKPTKPDQFTATAFLELGNRQTGGITGFYPYFNFLLVFRENGIDAITGDFPNFTVVPVSTDVGTRATNTVTNVPGLGVLFLASDGVYRIRSNMEYSDSPGIEKLTSHITKTTDRINPDCLAKACAVYSPKWNEWHCYFPADGNSLPTLGLVYHAEKKAFSLRENFPVSCVSRNYVGDIFFGHNEGASAGANEQAGLFVLSRRRALGESVVGDNLVDNSAPTSTYRSPWHDMGDETIKKSVHYVYLYVLTQGDNSISLGYYKDFGYTRTTSSGKKLQRADHLDQSVYGTAILTAGSMQPWEEPFVTAIRYPIAQGSCSHFQFEIETTNDLVLVGYAIEFTASGTRMIQGKTI